jgi:hypothetical protein
MIDGQIRQKKSGRRMDGRTFHKFAAGAKEIGGEPLTREGSSDRSTGGGAIKKKKRSRGF